MTRKDGQQGCSYTLTTETAQRISDRCPIWAVRRDQVLRRGRIRGHHARSRSGAQGNWLGVGDVRFRQLGSVWRNHLHINKRRIRIRPNQRLTFGLEEFVDHDGVAFVNGAARFSRGFAISNRCAGVDCVESCAVRKNNPAAIGNPSGIDRAMSLLQTLTGRRFMLSRISICPPATTRPVDGDSSE